MKSFEKFRKETEKHYVPDEPIHFKHIAHPKAEKFDAYVPDEPIHFKYNGPKNGKLNESSDGKYESKEKPAVSLRGWLNSHHQSEDDIDERNKDLEEVAPKLSSEHAEAVHEYSKVSHPLNRDLIDYHKKHGTHMPPEKGKSYYQDMYRYLDAATNHPIGRHVHVYSGIGFDPREHMKGTDKLHLPAYTSTSHSKKTAYEFARENSPNDRHILHVHLKPKDKALHAQPHSDMPDEHEIIIPRKTTLKVSKTPESHKETATGKMVHIWHATVHHQE